MIGNKGFTFIELIIVISIMIGLTLLTVPFIINYQRDQQINESVKNFISQYRTTQTLALSNDTTYTVNFVTEDGKNIIKFCPEDSTDCVVLDNLFTRNPELIRIDRYANLINISGRVIDRDIELLYGSNSSLILYRFGGIKR